MKIHNPMLILCLLLILGCGVDLDGTEIGNGKTEQDDGSTTTASTAGEPTQEENNNDENKKIIEHEDSNDAPQSDSTSEFINKEQMILNKLLPVLSQCSPIDWQTGDALKWSEENETVVVLATKDEGTEFYYNETVIARVEIIDEKQVVYDHNSTDITPQLDCDSSNSTQEWSVTIGDQEFSIIITEDGVIQSTPTDESDKQTQWQYQQELD